MDYNELLENVQTKKHFLLLLSSGCEHRYHGNSGRDTFFYMLDIIKDKASSLALTKDELKTALDNHCGNSERLDQVTNENIVLGLRKLLGNSEDTEDYIFNLLKKHRNLDVNTEHPFINKEHAVTSFCIDDYLINYQKNIINLEEVNQYFKHIFELIVEHKSSLDIEDIKVFNRKYDYDSPSIYLGRPEHQYFITSVNENPVSTQLVYNIINKAIDTIIEKVNKKENYSLKEEIADIILFYKLEHNLPNHDVKENKFKI